MSGVRGAKKRPAVQNKGMSRGNQAWNTEAVAHHVAAVAQHLLNTLMQAKLLYSLLSVPHRIHRGIQTTLRMTGRQPASMPRAALPPQVV